MKTGTDALTGKTVTGIPYLQQRIQDALNTPLGSLVGHRGYGSRLYEIIDRNVDPGFYMLVYIRLAEALSNPVNGLDDVELKEMQLTDVENHKIEMTCQFILLDNGSPITMEGIIIEQ
ncbi:hypothetical protein [Zooshikella ganghwensis]|uniref:Baseplate assembly protein W n=1 Tax=Zooshikella ganghwensis TaxID=202772 RepID=A0A4P9VGL8_9GAMM|nr:hypothetical protein [Zooshikella ganghwensis]RDH41514.1 baseplate assembly protein W [Zooshikella ganghwensis]RDH41543.1 baseplate assembly protein W [Zooshikella ganghwensis]